MRKAPDKKGGIIVEASITFPICVIMLATICWLIKACCIQAVLFDTVENELRYGAALSLPLPAAGVSRALDEAGIEGENYSVKGYAGGLSYGGAGGFERLAFTYDTELKLPVPLISDIFLDNRIVYRKWTGLNVQGTPFGFDAMKEAAQGDPVYIFPMAGTKYHNKNCRVVNSAGRTVSLNSGIRKKYNACVLCTTGSERDGQQVYIFDYGACYHNAGCHAVTKYIILMDAEDAASKGYSACSICGG